MLLKKTEDGSIYKTLKGDLYHTTFFKEFSSLAKKEEKIIMSLIDNGYIIKNKATLYVGGGVYEGYETYLNYDTGEYINETYTYVEHGVWKLKIKIKK